MSCSGTMAALFFFLALLLLPPHSASTSLSPSASLVSRSKSCSGGASRSAYKRPSPSVTTPVLKADPLHQTRSLSKKGSTRTLRSSSLQSGAPQLVKAKGKPRSGDYRHTERTPPTISDQSRSLSLASKPSEGSASLPDPPSVMDSSKQAIEINVKLDPLIRYLGAICDETTLGLIHALTRGASSDSATILGAALLDRLLAIESGLDQTLLLWGLMANVRPVPLPASLTFVRFPYMTVLVGLHSDMPPDGFRALLEALPRHKEGDSSISMLSDYTFFKQLTTSDRGRVKTALATFKKGLALARPPFSPKATLLMAALRLKAWDKFAVLLETAEADENVLIELISRRRVKLLDKALDRSLPGAINKPVDVHGLAIDAAVNIPARKLRSRMVRLLLKHGASFTATHLIASFDDLATLELFCTRIGQACVSRFSSPFFRFHYEDEQTSSGHSLWNHAVEQGRHKVIGVLSRHFGEDMLQVPSPVDGLTPLSRALQGGNEKVIAAVKSALQHAGLSDELPFTIDLSLLCGREDEAISDTSLESHPHKSMRRSASSTSEASSGHSSDSTASYLPSKDGRHNETVGEMASAFEGEESGASSGKQRGVSDHKLSRSLLAVPPEKEERGMPSGAEQDAGLQARLRYKENMAKRRRERMAASASLRARKASSQQHGALTRSFSGK